MNVIPVCAHKQKTYYCQYAGYLRVCILSKFSSNKGYYEQGYEFLYTHTHREILKIL